MDLRPDQNSFQDLLSCTELGGCRCGWEAQPQAFHWFPELGSPMASLPANNPLRPPAVDHRAADIR